MGCDGTIAPMLGCCGAGPSLRQLGMFHIAQNDWAGYVMGITRSPIYRTKRVTISIDASLSAPGGRMSGGTTYRLYGNPPVALESIMEPSYYYWQSWVSGGGMANLRRDAGCPDGGQGTFRAHTDWYSPLAPSFGTYLHVDIDLSDPYTDEEGKADLLALYNRKDISAETWKHYPDGSCMPFQMWRSFYFNGQAVTTPPDTGLPYWNIYDTGFPGGWPGNEDSALRFLSGAGFFQDFMFHGVDSPSYGQDTGNLAGAWVAMGDHRLCANVDLSHYKYAFPPVPAHPAERAEWLRLTPGPTSCQTHIVRDLGVPHPGCPEVFRQRYQDILVKADGQEENHNFHVKYYRRCP